MESFMTFKNRYLQYNNVLSLHFKYIYERNKCAIFLTFNTVDNILHVR